MVIIAFRSSRRGPSSRPLVPRFSLTTLGFLSTFWLLVHTQSTVVLTPKTSPQQQQQQQQQQSSSTPLRASNQTSATPVLTPSLALARTASSPSLKLHTSSSSSLLSSKVQASPSSSRLQPSTLSSSSPHLVFFMVDDQGYQDVGYHGSDIRTPVLDQLAAEGVKLENYYVQPICSPSRSQLMTGRYQIHTGLQHSIIRSRQPLCLPRDAPTLPERLQQAGYATHMVGKWHLGFCRPECLPTGRGFHSFLGSLTGSGDHFTHQSCDGAEACGFDLHDGERPAWELRGNYSTQVYTDRVKQILRSHPPDKPLFLYVALQALHTPLQAPAHLLRRYASLGNGPRSHYAAMLSGVDEAVGEVVRELRARGLYRNSVLVYSSDNGGQPLSGGCNWPLRGGKGSYWEGGVRAVGFVHSPLLKRRGAVSRALVHVSDWYPTLLGLAGVPLEDKHLDGHDVWATISEGKPCPRTEILFNIDPVSRRKGEPAQQRALRTRRGFGIWDTGVRAVLRAGDWKLLTGPMGDGDWFPPPPPPSTHPLPGAPPPPRPHWQGLEKRRDLAAKSVWLFNVTADPYERFDLSDVRPEVVRMLMERIAEYNRTAVPPQNPPDDPLADPQLHGGVWTPWLGREGANSSSSSGGGVKLGGAYRGAVAVRHCKVCRLRALFKRVGYRMQRASLFF
ncbi:arylsulfatase I [Engraulis encrasicolus]|uniref:arylsulfatase I n=1 Tax=Engraulis encrasicolus TaxID=184585 RepID=UPI002FD4DF05